MYTVYKKYLGIITISVFISLLIYTPLLAADCIKCHPQIKKGENLHPPVEECDTCHESINKHPLKGVEGFKLTEDLPDLCYECHESKIKEEHKHPPVEAGECTSCHNPHSSKNEKLLVENPPGLCYSCHERKDKKKFTHVPVAEGECLSCHNPHSSKQESLLVAEGNELCLGCHSDKEEALEKETVHPPAADDCKNCHDPHGTDFAYQLKDKMNDLCFNCHDKEEFSVHVISGVMSRRSIHPLEGVKDPSHPDRNISCVSCHNPHGTDTPRLWNFGAKVRFKLCQGCHKDK
jgi:predicted CXXCH cytochrome family protein